MEELRFKAPEQADRMEQRKAFPALFRWWFGLDMELPQAETFFGLEAVRWMVRGVRLLRRMIVFRGREWDDCSLNFRLLTFNGVVLVDYPDNLSWSTRAQWLTNL